MKNIIHLRVTPEDQVHLKKGMFGYRVVQPIKNENGTTNWLNFIVGGWGNLFKLLFVLLIIFSFIYGVQEMMEGCNDMANNPCKYTDLDCSTFSTLGTYEPTGFNSQGLIGYEQ